MTIAMQPLFKQRVLRNIVNAERSKGTKLPAGASSIIQHWVDQLKRGTLAKLTESSIEQTFTAELFGRLLGYQQIGQATEASLRRSFN